MDDLRVDAPEFDPRVDRLFASAMEQQLEEQRTLTRLAGRVEAALDEFQRGLDGLTADLTAAALPLPAEVERTRDTVLEAVSRLERDAAESRSEVLDALQRLGEQLDVSGLRGAFADLLDRVDQGTTPLPAAIEDVQSRLTAVLEGIGRATAAARGDLSGWLNAVWEEFEGRLSSGQEEAARAVAAAQRALGEQVHRLEGLRETLAAQTGHAADRVAALLDHATANQREALAAIGAAASQLAAEASSAREVVTSQSEALRETVAEAASVAQAGLDRSLQAARTVSEEVATSGAASQEAVEQMRALVAVLTTRLEEGQAAGTRRLSQAATVLERAVEGLEPSLAALVDDLRQALLEAAAAERAQSAASKAVLREAANGAVEELRGIVDDVARRFLDAHASGTAELASAAAGVTQAAEELQPAFSSALAKLYGAVAAAASQVRATTEDAAARTDAALAAALSGIESTISDRLAETGAASQEVASRLAETQISAVTRLEDAAVAVEQQAASLHPALAEAADELRRSLLEAAAEDRLRMEVWLGAVQQAAEAADDAIREAADAAVERLEAAVTGAAEQLAAAQTADTSMLADAAEHVARTAEALAPAVSAAISQVDGTVTEAIAVVEGALVERLAQSDAAAQAAAADLRAASNDAQERLRVWLAGALPDAVAEVTTGLTDQLERIEARVDATAQRMENVWGTVGSGLQAAAEDASVRMIEAARALTAVASDSVGTAERRFAALTKQLDALLERMDVVADAEGRRADAAEEALVALRRALGEEAGPRVVNLSPRAEKALEVVTERAEAVLASIRQVDAAADLAVERDASDHHTRSQLEAALFQLQDVLERTENVERLVTDGLDRAARQLEAASSGLARIETSLVGYLRERDATAATERERLLTDLVDQLGAILPRKESRLLSGLLSSGRRREAEPPFSPPYHQAVRPDPVMPETTRSPSPSVPAERPGGPRESAPAGEMSRAGRPAQASPAVPACEVCGFVAKSPGGLAAHQRTHRNL